jgi:CRISPR-associated endonuclease/helicase Cas3
MSKPEPIAKPSGVPLRAHRQHVYDETVRILEARPFLAKKYKALTGDDLRFSARRAAWWHDIGKADEVGWQKACRRDHESYRAWRQSSGLDPDKIDASDYRCYEKHCYTTKKNPGGNLLAFARSTGYRHEFESLRQMLRKSAESFSMAEQVAVAAHHRHLSYRVRDQERWETSCGGRFGDVWKTLRNHDRLIFRDEKGKLRIDADEWSVKLLERYRLSGPRSLLQLADTRASRQESGDWLPPIEATSPFPYAFPYKSPRGVQQVIEELWDHQIGMLRAPTGSGKTDAALLWIKHQVESGRADRGVIAMPTRFTANALELNLRASVGETGLYHSSAWYTRFGDTSGMARSNARERHNLARLLISPVTVCTVDHLLIALSGTREDHHAIFFNLAHAAVVFDEVDFYDPFVQANLTVLLDVFRAFGVPVLLMSATLPESSRTLYRVSSSVVEAAEEPRTSRRWLAWGGEAEIQIGMGGKVLLSAGVDAVFRKMLERGTGIIYANTVLRAWRYRRWFEQEGVRKDDLVLYHSRFTEPDKKSIEAKLLNSLGVTAWKKGSARGIAILTQIGEMSVNISAPIMLTEACPWDRLAQRAGRNGRFDMEGDATLYVTLPTRDGAPYCAPYGTLVDRQGWVPSRFFERSVSRMRELLNDGPGDRLAVDAAFFVGEVNDLYPSAPDFSGGAEENRARLYDWMRKAWMIVTPREADEEHGVVEGKWRTRDILPQVTVFVRWPEAEIDDPDDADGSVYRFENWDAYHAFELEYGISIPTYLMAKEQRRKADSRLVQRRVIIGDDYYRKGDPESMTMWHVSRYNDRDGLAWMDDQYGEAEENGIV